MCLEPLTEDQFRFPCGHGVCTGCNGRLAQRDFLSCPTCRTPREGVSQRQVERANHARAREDAAEAGESLVVFAGGRQFEVLFFPDESDGQHPFAPLGGPPGTLHEVRPDGVRRARGEEAPDPEQQQAALQAAEAALAADEAGHGMGTRQRSQRLTLRGPVRDLVDALTRPTTMQEFLAHREGALRAL